MASQERDAAWKNRNMSRMSRDTLESDGQEQDTRFPCRICHEWHELPFSYSVKAPSAVASIPEPELDQRVIFTLDQSSSTSGSSTCVAAFRFQ
jgi:hypothetical protein